jgi:hypothetical protein
VGRAVPPDALDLGEWGATVRVLPDEPLRAALLERQRAGPLEGAVSVTEVLEPRPAYWKRLHPVPPTAERAARMRAGQEMHVLAGHLMAPASAREIRRRRDGIVARIDLLDDRVTELKTTTLRGTPDGTSVRSSYLEQLAVYCGLLERSQGRLVLIDPTPGSPPKVEAYDAGFPTAGLAWAEALRRAAQLRSALQVRSAAELPRCPWRDRGCEFRSAAVCDCTGNEVPAAADAFGPLPVPDPAPEAARRLAEALAARPAGPGIRRFRDLVYPRRAFYERTVPLEEGGREWTPPPGGRTEDLWRTISDLLETGAAGEVASVDPPDGEPLERVTTLDGRPMVLKTTRSWNPPAPERVLAAQPQYILELGLRCAAAGTDQGTLLVGYERILPWDRRVQAYRVSFDPPDAIRAVIALRTRDLRDALASGRPAGLPACPGWMYEGCAYRPDCACAGGAGPGVDQRKITV